MSFEPNKKPAVENVKRKESGKSHVVCKGNRRVIHANREAIGAMKYKGQ